jgi:tight adherence protein B
MEWVIGIGLFVAAILVVGGVILLLRPKWDPESRTIEKRLEKFAGSDSGQQEVDVIRRRKLSEVPKLNALLSRIPVMHRLDELVVQSNSRLPLGVFVLLAVTIALTVYLLLSLSLRQQFMPALIGVAAGATPFLYLSIKKTQRVRKFERQLPDALDLMARSLKAGHAFSGGLQMVAEEFDDPVGTEFMRVMNEINYGAPVDQALKSMAQRVDVPDLKFFTVSVIIQRESGGNLAEILESIARLIRERFKLLGKIKALSAEGKLSGIILVALPFLVVLALSILNPKYLPVLVEDPAGRVMVITALCMMAFGIFLIRKLIQIRV